MTPETRAVATYVLNRLSHSLCDESGRLCRKEQRAIKEAEERGDRAEVYALKLKYHKEGLAVARRIAWVGELREILQLGEMK